MFPLQVRSVSGAEVLREVRTSCGLFRRSTHMVRKSGGRPYVLHQEVTGSIPVGSIVVSSIYHCRLHGRPVLTGQTYTPG
jgi:hypothetical protein